LALLDSVFGKDAWRKWTIAVFESRLRQIHLTIAIKNGNVTEEVMREIKNGEWNRKICMGPYIRSMDVVPNLEDL
jgi:hypothetical protein